MKKFHFFIIAIGAFLVDLLTKILFQKLLGSPYNIIIIIKNVFEIRWVKNFGLLFGIFERFPFTIKVLIMFVSLTVFFLFIYLSFNKLGKLEKWAFALILGGGFGNFFDRLIHGGVFDFLQIFIGKYPWPTFNFADMIIDIGIGLILIDIFLGGKNAPDPH
ncbi:signal peptidase II [bacterium]|nr:signal peptidase II [bacterium]